MKVYFNNRTRQKIPEKLLEKAALLFAADHRVKAQELSVAFVGDSVMRRLNRDCRGYDRTTDVLSFPDEGQDFGEIIINPLRVRRQAPNFSNEFRAEMLFIFVHGLLHLLGHEDRDEKELAKMMRLGRDSISKHRLL